MEENIKPNVLIMITNSFAALNVIHSGLIKRLAARYNLFVFSDLIGEPEILHINKHFNIEMQLITALLPGEIRRVKWLRLFQKMLFCHLYQIKTLDLKIREKGALFYLVYRITTIFLKIKSVNVKLLTLCRRCIISIIQNRQLNASLDQLNLHGVISTSPLDVRENQVINFLKKKQVKSIAMVISWDNLSSKGLINADHGMVIVWNSFIAEEYKHYYAAFETGSRVCIGGIPRFDLYSSVDASKLCAFRNELGIGPQNKVILLATSSVKHIPSHRYIVTHLLEYMELHPEVVLLVRCHPGDRPEDYQSFRNLANFHCFPADSQARKTAMLPMDFLNTLQMQLGICHVCVQVASTMRLDAAACNKPVVSIAYKDPESTSNAPSITQLYNYSHQIPLNNLHIDRMVYGKSDLFTTLDDLLDPLTTKPDYRKMIGPFIHCSGPDATTLTMQHFREWL